MSVARPVSVETLASIPWMSAKSLPQTMREVSIRGPHDAETWHQLVSRADVISGSLNAKQSALLLNSLARVFGKNLTDSGPFLRRFLRKFLPQTLHSMNALDVSQVVHALGQFGSQFMTNELRNGLSEKLREVVPEMDPKSLSMTALGVSRLQLWDCTDCVLQRALELQELLEGQSMAQIFNLAASTGSETAREPIRQLAACVSSRVQSFNVRSLSVILNSIARLKADCPDLVSLVSDDIMDPHGSRYTIGASLSQLVVLLRSLQKLGVLERNPLVAHRLVDIITTKSIDESADTAILCTLLVALSKMKGYSSLIDKAFSYLRDRKLNTEQVTVLVQVASRCEKEALLEWLAPKITDKSLRLTGQQISLIASACERLGHESVLVIITSLGVRARMLEAEKQIKHDDLNSIQTIMNRLA